MENEREKRLLESIQSYVQAEYTNKSIKFTENSPVFQSYNISPISTNTDIVNQIRSGIDVILTPSTTQNTPIEESLRSNSVILPPVPNNTPISPKAIIIPTNHVAEGEPIPPLPLWSKVGFDHIDYPIKNKLLTDMINRDSEKGDF